MLSDTDLAKGKAVQPQRAVVQPTKNRLSRPKKRLKLWLFVLANVVVWSVVFYIFVADEKSHTWKYLLTNRGMVKGIIYHAENPSAIVRGKVVHEGETVDGYKVVKIHRDKVILERNGKYKTIWVQ